MTSVFPPSPRSFHTTCAERAPMPSGLPRGRSTSAIFASRPTSYNFTPTSHDHANTFRDPNAMVSITPLFVSITTCLWPNIPFTRNVSVPCTSLHASPLDRRFVPLRSRASATIATPCAMRSCGASSSSSSRTLRITITPASSPLAKTHEDASKASEDTRAAWSSAQTRLNAGACGAHAPVRRSHA